MKLQIEINKNVKRWLVELAGDGAHWSFVVNGDLEAVKKELTEQDSGEFNNDLDDEDLWDMYGVFQLDLEQAYMRVTPIRAKLKKASK